jgi:Domain of unknown function (DUF4386)
MTTWNSTPGLSSTTASDMTTRRWTAGLMIAEAVTVTVPVIILGAAIGFPGILDAPAAVAFKAFDAAQGAATLGYSIFCLSSLLLLPLAVMASRTLGNGGSLGQVAEVLGITAGITQLLGFTRWLFLVPFLSGQYFDPQTSQATKDTVAVVYDSFNVMSGKAVGEHLGFVFLGTWMVAITVLASRSLPAWINYSGAVIGLMILLSAFVGLLPSIAPFLETLNFLANTVWVFWLLAVAILLLRRPHSS